MKTTIQLRAIDLISNLGNMQEGVPYRWLESLVAKVKERVPDDEEVTCLVHGLPGLVFSYEHTLTPMEKAQAQVAQMQGVAAEIRQLIPREGALTEAQTARLRQLLSV